jgi:hypothetical protein
METKEASLNLTGYFVHCLIKTTVRGGFMLHLPVALCGFHDHNHIGENIITKNLGMLDIITLNILVFKIAPMEHKISIIMF